MAKNQEDGITILLGLKDYKVKQDVYRKRRVKIPKKIFLVGRGKLNEERKQRVDELLDKYPDLKGFYWAKEKIRGLYRQEDREEATKLLDNIIFNLKSADDGELIRWASSLQRLDKGGAVL